MGAFASDRQDKWVPYFIKHSAVGVCVCVCAHVCVCMRVCVCVRTHVSEVNEWGAGMKPRQGHYTHEFVCVCVCVCVRYFAEPLSDLVHSSTRCNQSLFLL